MLLFIKTLHIIFSCILVASEASVSDVLLTNISEDGLLNFTQLASKYGRKCEEFDIETEDGYILKLFHITGNESKKPVLLMHGLLDSADAFIIRGKISIAINLAEAGYDVWAGNVRGNKYSRRNIKLSPDKNTNDFWDFSFHEVGIYDLPTTIDFILKDTGKEKLSAVGFSQGTSIFYALGSVKPEYNKKISVLISLAPVAYLTNTGPGFSIATNVFKHLGLLGYDEVLRDNSAENKLIQFICSQGQLAYHLCVKGLLSFIMGDDLEEFEPAFVNVVIGHFPAGASWKAFAHYAQIEKSARFAQYDYGVVKNLLLYKSATSPAYNLSRATMPIVLIAAKNDRIAVIKDVERLKNELPNVVYYHVMERKKFNHIDYIWGKHLDVYVNPLLRDLLRKFT